MGRKCRFPGCKNTSGLHSFPSDPEMRRRWLSALGLPLDTDLLCRYGVCTVHFEKQCFSNHMEVDMGYAKVLQLNSDAVPNPVPVTTPDLNEPATSATRPLRHIVPNKTRDIGCQTEPVSTKHAFVQANVKPNIRSKAIQARAPNRSVYCDTDSLVANPEALEKAEVPRTSFVPVKRTRCEVSTDDSSCRSDVAESTMNGTSTTNEVLAHSMTTYIVYEDSIMELFKRCPVCSRSCIIQRTVIGTLLQVKQSCAHCEHFYQWSSQPVNNTPAQKYQVLMV